MISLVSVKDNHILFCQASFHLIIPSCPSTYWCMEFFFPQVVALCNSCWTSWDSSLSISLAYTSSSGWQHDPLAHQLVVPALCHLQTCWGYKLWSTLNTLQTAENTLWLVMRGGWLSVSNNEFFKNSEHVYGPFSQLQ